jgi:hypothetical protein
MERVEWPNRSTGEILGWVGERQRSRRVEPRLARDQNRLERIGSVALIRK